MHDERAGQAAHYQKAGLSIGRRLNVRREGKCAARLPVLPVPALTFAVPANFPGVTTWPVSEKRTEPLGSNMIHLPVKAGYTLVPRTVPWTVVWPMWPSLVSYGGVAAANGWVPCRERLEPALVNFTVRPPVFVAPVLARWRARVRRAREPKRRA